MEIPDKIYCGNNGHGNRSFSTEKVYDTMEEYIRKDALLGWAKETEKSRIRIPVEADNNEDYQAGFIDGFDKFRMMLNEKLKSL